MRFIQSGYLEALEQLYRRYALMVRSGIARFVSGIAEADIDELCQEVFFAVQKSAHKYTEQQKFKSWLYGITAKKSHQWNRNNWLRRNLSNQFVTENTAMALPVQSGNEERLAMRRLIDEALAQLSYTVREAFILSASEGYTAKEIAEILQVNKRTVFTRIYRARQQLGEILQGRLGYVPQEVNDDLVS